MSDGAVSYARTPRTTPTRYKDRATWEQDAIHAILDSTYLCHLGFVADGAPVVLPTIFARVGDRLYIHGSTGSRPLRGAKGDQGLPVCVTVTLVDALVLTKSAFNHSINFRSVVAHGTAHQVTDPRSCPSRWTRWSTRPSPAAPPRSARPTPRSWPPPPSSGSTWTRSPPRPVPTAPTTTRRTSTSRTGPAWCRWPRCTAPPCRTPPRPCPSPRTCATSPADGARRC